MSAETEAAPTTGTETGHMTLMEHIAELRTRILRVIIALAIAAVVAWFLYQPILDVLRGPLQETAPEQVGGDAFLSTEPLQPFQVRIKITTYTAIALSMPVILWQIWRFVAPGLYENERKYGLVFISVGTALFASGAAIAFWTLPKALQFLQTIGGEENFTQYYTATSYLKLVVYMMVAFGIGFEFPLIVTTLNLVGAVTTDTLRRVRRYVVVVVAIFVAVATPSGDPISMLALTVPMCILYEVSILIGRIRDRRKRKADEAEAAAATR
ncbi:MAG TPA: twin-arginine translocase subunit TatC [Iamia sp.]|nr:twin-arginine translocase subunit TatC [Iamia sp.]